MADFVSNKNQSRKSMAARHNVNRPPVVGGAKKVETDNDVNFLSKQMVHANWLRPPTVPNGETRVTLKVPLCCQGCEEKVRFELTTLDGVNEISVDVETQKVVVVGEVQASTVLSTVKKVMHRAELWRN